MSQGRKKNMTRPGLEPKTSRIPCEHSCQLSYRATRSTCDNFPCLNRFVPESIDLRRMQNRWNSLDIELRNSLSMASFKYQLKKKHQNNSKVPTYYRVGNRYISVFHLRIRNNCSNLLSNMCISLAAQTSEMKEKHFFDLPRISIH